MKSIATLILLLITVASCRDVIRVEVSTTSNIWDWLRFFGLAPPNDCNGASKGDKVEDKLDCNKFFLCLGDGIMSPDSYACTELVQDYQCFSPSDGDCTTESNICEEVCPKAPECKTVCNDTLDQLADMTNCGRHYLCLEAGENAETILFDCPADLPYFDGMECVDDKSACCNCQLGECTFEGQLIADPKNCHQFYYCEPTGNNIVPLGPFPCADGGSFDNGNCRNATSCDTTCELGNTTTSA